VGHPSQHKVTRKPRENAHQMDMYFEHLVPRLTILYHDCMVRTRVFLDFSVSDVSAGRFVVYIIRE
jgi:hypothetical protein